jgi:hypothetical protein
LRKVNYQAEQNRYFEFLTNNFDISADDFTFLENMEYKDTVKENEAELTLTLLLWIE